MGESRSAAPSAGATSTGASLMQLGAGSTLKCDLAERVSGHPSNTASTRHSTVPGGTRCVIDVSVVFSTSMSLPLSVQCTRYSVAFATALQTNATGDVAVVPSCGETICGPAVAHPAEGMTKPARAETTEGQFSKNVPTNH